MTFNAKPRIGLALTFCLDRHCMKNALLFNSAELNLTGPSVEKDGGKGSGTSALRRVGKSDNDFPEGNKLPALRRMVQCRVTNFFAIWSTDNEPIDNATVKFPWAALKTVWNA